MITNNVILAVIMLMAGVLCTPVMGRLDQSKAVAGGAVDHEQQIGRATT